MINAEIIPNRMETFMDIRFVVGLILGLILGFLIAIVLITFILELIERKSAKR